MTPTKALSITRPVRFVPRNAPVRQPSPSASIAGQVLRMREVAGFRLFEVEYRAGLELQPHFHPQGHLIYVLTGSYSETCATGPVELGPKSLRYLPPGHKHGNHFSRGARCVVIEIAPAVLARVNQSTNTLERAGEIEGPVSSWLAERLCDEFQRPMESGGLALEGMLLELTAEAARRVGQGVAKIVPEWLKNARRHLESNCLRSVSLAEIARVSGMHRVHVSREFRKHFGTTIGEFLRNLRVEHARRLLKSTTQTLTDIALDCGFADQSHFSATFRRLTGLTPAVFRQMALHSRQDLAEPA
jgi:AraC family transcriptional regulator